MGKNRKLRNGADSVQNYCIIETENHNQEIPEDFLTSDDFCIVQKKKGCKKFLDSQDSKELFRSLTDSGKNFYNQDTGKSTSFWTHEINESINDNLTTDTTDDLDLQCSSGELELSSENSGLQSEDILDFRNDVNKLNLEASVNGENLSPKKIEPSLSNSDTFQNGILEVKSLSDKNVVIETNVCCTKKKNKKRENRKNSLDEEVERLIKELDLDGKPFACKDSAVLPLVVSDNHSQLHKVVKNANIETCNSFRHAEENSEVIKIVPQPKVENNSSDIHNANNIDKEPVAKDNVTKSMKRRVKKEKAKQKTTENESSEVYNPCELNNLSDIGEAVDIRSGFSSSKEKISKPKATNESDRRSKNCPSKKQLAIIHEALKKAKEEEERLKKEEEIKRKMAEEVEKIRQEKLRQEQEKKERKKLKEKQRREKMKAEGRFLTKSQKLSRVRMEATLAALRQQGVDVPQIGDKKPPSSHGPRLGNCKNFHRKRYDSCQSTQSSDSAVILSERQKSESVSSQESSGKDSLLDLPSSFDSTDESPLISESDKRSNSFSEESDGLDDGICCDITKNKNKNKPLESDPKVNNMKYRSPIVCVLGHVDTGKTKLLDYIRKTHVQDSEAGGITQQIGATMIPKDALKEKCKMVRNFVSFNMQIPGLLVIDTPGHESFSNLRSRGSSVCDIAILVVDIMHGLEPQTIESINLLKKSKTPFIVALNKVDRIYGWKSAKDEDIENTIKNQSQSTLLQFKKRCQEITLQFANQCLNVVLFYENKDPRSYVSMVPASAITGDGMGNILSNVTHLTQTLMHKKLIFSNELEATVLEVKAIPGLGTTIDVILVNGRLQEGDTIVVAGQEGPIVTQIRSLLMPRPLRELRVKNPYIEYKVIEGAQGVKITGRDLEKSIAGLPLFVASNHNMIDVLKGEVNHLFHDAMNLIKTSERGVYVQASTLGSLEALLDFLTASGIPYFNVKIGPVVKKDVMKASIMLEHDSIYAAILAFDVKIERDAQELADNLGVHIFHADIIYHLFDLYIKYRDDLLLKREEKKQLAVFPCKLRILSELASNSGGDFIISDVLVEQGTAKEGTPLCVPSRDILEIGVISSIEMNNNKISCAKKGDKVCIKIDPKPGEPPKILGKHFFFEDFLVSRISRQSIDACKEHSRNELQPSDWHLIVELKKMLHIV